MNPLRYQASIASEDTVRAVFVSSGVPSFMEAAAVSPLPRSRASSCPSSASRSPFPSGLDPSRLWKIFSMAGAVLLWTGF